MNNTYLYTINGNYILIRSCKNFSNFLQHEISDNTDIKSYEKFVDISNHQKESNLNNIKIYNSSIKNNSLNNYWMKNLQR
jgi:hypothetical protein